MIDDKTTNLLLPLPHADNAMSDDVVRLRQALTSIDSELQLKSTAADITAAVNALVGAAPGALNTLVELAAAIGNDANFSASVAAHIGAGGAAHSIVTTLVAGFMSASDKTKLDGVSGSNSGDNSANTLYSGLVTNATHTGDATGSTALTVVKINGTLMSALATGILKNTTGTGSPSIAVAGEDFQAPLVSGTNIKTLNGASLLGGGDVVVRQPESFLFMDLGVI